MQPTQSNPSHSRHIKTMLLHDYLLQGMGAHANLRCTEAFLIFRLYGRSSQVLRLLLLAATAGGGSSHGQRPTDRPVQLVVACQSLPSSTPAVIDTHTVTAESWSLSPHATTAVAACQTCIPASIPACSRDVVEVCQARAPAAFHATNLRQEVQVCAVTCQLKSTGVVLLQLLHLGRRITFTQTRCKASHGHTTVAFAIECTRRKDPTGTEWQ